ncbi:uncharacterized protein PG998_009641 [Apiospora kogelbergensis]|uniref:uncharacterized protein n=1 Tax=Apiospora kogelbergensis TaxID=1337665 RepID=UPI00312FFC95
MFAPEQSTASAAASPRWASSDDWDVYRGTITHLYEVEDMTLEKVMNSMLNKHGFLATYVFWWGSVLSSTQTDLKGKKKMYKNRFKRWGLQKNLRYEQVSQLLQQDQTHELAPESAPQEVLIEGRKIDPRKVKQYLRRTKRPGLKTSPGTGRVAKMTSAVSRLTPPPEPSILSTPDIIRIPEECMWILRDWVRASFQGGLWDTSGTVKNYDYTYRLIFWNNSLAQVRTELQRGQTAQAFEKFGQCLEQYKQFLRDEDPRLFIYTYLVICRLFVDHPDLARSLVGYTHELCKVINGNFHPLSRVMEKIRRMNPCQVQEYAQHFIMSYLDSMASERPDCTHFAMENLQLRSRLLTSLADEGLIDRETAIAKCHAVLRDIDKRPGLSWTSIYVGLRQTMAYFMKKRAQTGASGEVPAALQRFAHLEQWYLYLGFKTSTDSSNRAGMMAAANKLTKIPMQDLDMRGRQAWMLADLETHLRRLNISDAAEDVSQSYTEVLNNILGAKKTKAATSELGKPVLE